MLSRLVPVVLLATLFWTSCQKDPNTDPQCPFAPFATGALFAYSSATGDFVLESVGDTLLDGYWYARLRRFPGGAETLYRCDGNDYFFSGYLDAGDRQLYVHDFPYLKLLQPGASWTYATDWATFRCTLEATGLQRVVGEYYFKDVSEVKICVLNASGQPQHPARYWYASGFGLIESEAGQIRLTGVSDRFE